MVTGTQACWCSQGQSSWCWDAVMGVQSPCWGGQTGIRHVLLRYGLLSPMPTPAVARWLHGAHVGSREDMEHLDVPWVLGGVWKEHRRSTRWHCGRGPHLQGWN